MLFQVLSEVTACNILNVEGHSSAGAGKPFSAVIFEIPTKNLGVLAFHIIVLVPCISGKKMNELLSRLGYLALA